MSDAWCAAVTAIGALPDDDDHENDDDEPNEYKDAAGEEV